MRYAFWNLIEESANYFVGPESKIIELGGSAEGAWSDNSVASLGKILGYVSGNFDTAGLSGWNYEETTQAVALEFCQSINPEAYVMENGRITAPIEE